MGAMASGLPSIIVTGASGFIGGYFLEAAREKYRIIAVARRSQKEAGIRPHRNITWLQSDISNRTSLKALAHRIKHEGGADFVLHLAGYYDFSLKDNPEYELTNVLGTQNMLILAKLIYARRFIFASSLAISNFLNRRGKITESSPPDAGHPYAVSKRKGEELVKSYSAWVPASIVRFAAVFSDWCQYPPLYVFLSTWLSKKWNSRIIAGRGESAVSYIHIDELIRLLFTILEKSDSLPNCDTYIASPDGCTTHRELFGLATWNYYGRKIAPFLVPKLLAWPGAAARNALGTLMGNPPFEKPWMVGYIDQKLDVDASYTSRVLGWQCGARGNITGQVLYLVARMKSEPEMWKARNESALQKTALRPAIIISEEMAVLKSGIVREIIDSITGRENVILFRRLAGIGPGVLEEEISEMYDLLMTSVRQRDRGVLFNFICYFCFRHVEEGIDMTEVRTLLFVVNEILVRNLAGRLNHRIGRQDIHDSLSLILFIIIDEIVDIYENVLFKKKIPG